MFFTKWKPKWKNVVIKGKKVSIQEQAVTVIIFNLIVKSFYKYPKLQNQLIAGS